MNDPRCDIQDCRNQAAGTWFVADRSIPLCLDDKEDLERQGITLAGEWTPFIPGPVLAAIDRRLTALAAGYFG